LLLILLLEDAGLIWKHSDRRLPDTPEVRRSRRLVISAVSTVENYEYGFFWYFYQDGNIQFEMKLTGILSLAVFAPLKEDETRGASEVKSEGSKESTATASAASGPIHGCMIKPLLYAPNHQHFFNMRLDVGIDGSENTIYQVDVVADEEDEEKNPFHNAFHAVATPLKTELQACADLNLETGRTWKFANPNIKSRFGVPRAYKFIPGDNAKPFASKKAWWRKRAGFVDHHVWVTPFSESEYFAAGDFPNQSCGGDGLIAWTKADRPIENKDVVFWYTFGHNHIPRPEDSPVMPAAYIGFLLKPAGFFDENPSNDVGPSVSTHSRCGH
jgi:primary-amine oxidase